MKPSNPYLETINRNLPRVLSLINIDSTSQYFGVADRSHWSWKLTDYPNASFQAASSGLLRLSYHSLLPEYVSRETVEALAVASLLGIEKVMGKNGAVDEAFPNEGSFCVAGLLLGQVADSLPLLPSSIDDETVEKIRMIGDRLGAFLLKQDEHHGIISNHLATSAYGLAAWGAYRNDNRLCDRSRILINRIKDFTSREGWFTEYGGCDPGYQSWTNAALSQLHDLDASYDTLQMVKNSIDFIEYFTFPDGSFSNGLGSRLTRFMYPSANEFLAADHASAKRLALFARKSISQRAFVTLDAVDEGNLAPLFNDYCLAAILCAKQNELGDPAPRKIEPMTHFTEAKILCAASETHYSVINIDRGGCMVTVDGDGNRQSTPPPLVKNKKDEIFFGGLGRAKRNDGQRLVISGDFLKRYERFPTPLDFIILRLMSLSVFRIRVLGNLVKKCMAYLLIGRKIRSRMHYRRTIDLQTGSISDEVEIVPGFEVVRAGDGFSPFHMASQGYWQRGD